MVTGFWEVGVSWSELWIRGLRDLHYATWMSRGPENVLWMGGSRCEKTATFSFRHLPFAFDRMWFLFSVLVLKGIYHYTYIGFMICRGRKRRTL